MHWRERTPVLAFWALFLAAYGGTLLYTRGLTFPLDRDELHYWPTSVAFGRGIFAMLRQYDEVNTPLPFILFGQFARIGEHGLALARAANLALSAGIVLSIAYAPGNQGRITRTSALASAGLLSCVYFLGFATHVYTDVIAASCAVAGISFHLRGRYGVAALFWILAIASRQPMAAFPLGVAAWELASRDGNPRSPARWIWPLVGAASLLGWMGLFGGLVPPNGSDNWEVGSPGPFVAHGLYFLVTVGAYYCAPEFVLFGPDAVRRVMPRRVTMAALAAALAMVFLIAPPTNNPPGYGMGLVDSSAHALVDGRVPAPTAIRMIIFYLLALWAVVRMAKAGLPAWLVGANVAVAIWIPLAWDKYVVPLACVLWFLKARFPDGLQEPASSSPNYRGNRVQRQLSAAHDGRKL